MKYILTSPESNQTKTIGLVRELYKKVKQHPYRVYTIIQLFLNYECTKEAGNELQSEIVKVCPKLRSRLPLQHQQFDAGNEEKNNSKSHQQRGYQPLSVRERCVVEPSPCRGNIHMHAISSTGNSYSSISTFTELNQPASHLHCSPEVSEYSKYLKSYYKTRLLAQADKYLPTLSAPYINLAIVSREGRGLKDRDELTKKLILYGGIDQILKHKASIPIEDLLSPNKVGGVPVRFVLVEGPPGIGKSTFAWELCRMWDKHFGGYVIVLLLRLREEWVQNAKEVHEIFRYECKPKLSQRVVEDLALTCGRYLLLIMDGFDEISHCLHDDSVIRKILRREIFPECTIFLSTRPSAKTELFEICQPQVDKHVEIIGFTEEERVRYIIEVYSHEPELQANFLKYVFLIPHIKSMMYIPLNCAIISRVYYESQQRSLLALSCTRTQLYKALTHCILVRHMKGKKESKYDNCTLPEGLVGNDRIKFEKLAKFAYQCCYNNEKKVTFFRDDVPRGLAHFGFMNESSEMYAEKGVKKALSFLHLSLQEFLAGWYMARRCDTKTQAEHISLAVLSKTFEMKVDESEDEECRLLAKMMQEKLNSSLDPPIFMVGIIGKEINDEDWDEYLRFANDIQYGLVVLIRLIYEAQIPSLLPSKYFAIESRRNVVINQNLTPYDCYALSYCVAHSSTTLSLKVIFLEDNNELVALVEIFVKGVNDYRKSEYHIGPSIKQLDLMTICCFPETANKCLYWLSELKSLSKIQVADLFIGEVDHHIFSLFLKSMRNLQSLKIILFPQSLEWLDALKFLKELKELVIYNPFATNPQPAINITKWPDIRGLKCLSFSVDLLISRVHNTQNPGDHLLHSLFQSVLRPNHITELRLPCICRKTMGIIKDILWCCPNLASFDLVKARLGYEGVLFICNVLKRNKTLKCLLIYDDGWPVSYLGLQVGCPGTIPTFLRAEEHPLPEKITCTEFLLQLSYILQMNNTLEKISIQTGLFFPQFHDEEELIPYLKWTGLGPLQQFNMASVASGRTPNLRRSFSSSDLTQPQKTLLWSRAESSLTKRNLIKSSLPSFTAPDSQILKSFSGLDIRLKTCLKIAGDNLQQHVERLYFNNAL